MERTGSVLAWTDVSLSSSREKTLRNGQSWKEKVEERFPDQMRHSLLDSIVCLVPRKRSDGKEVYLHHTHRQQERRREGDEEEAQTDRQREDKGLEKQERPEPHPLP